MLKNMFHPEDENIQEAENDDEWADELMDDIIFENFKKNSSQSSIIKKLS